MFAPDVSQDCKACSRVGQEQQRAIWGCDTDSPNTWFYIDCWECDGTQDECSTCDGAGTVSFRRCPHGLSEPWARHVCGLSTYVETHGVFPAAGGIYDQANWFFEASQIALSEKAKHDEERMNRSNDG